MTIIIIKYSSTLIVGNDLEKNGVWNFDAYKIHLRVGFMQKNN